MCHTDFVLKDNFEDKLSVVKKISKYKFWPKWYISWRPVEASRRQFWGHSGWQKMDFFPLIILKQHSSSERVDPFGVSPTQSQSSLPFVNGEGKQGVWRSLKSSEKYRRQGVKDEITPLLAQPWHLVLHVIGPLVFLFGKNECIR